MEAEEDRLNVLILVEKQKSAAWIHKEKTFSPQIPPLLKEKGWVETQKCLFVEHHCVSQLSRSCPEPVSILNMNFA